MNSNLEKRKITYGCNHCNTMRLSQNLMNEHFRCKHQTKPKNKNLDQIPSWDYSQPCYLCNQTQPYYMSDAACNPMGNKLCIDCIRQYLEYSDDYLCQYSLNCLRCKKKHKLEFTHGLFLEALCGKIPEHSVIDICD